MYDETLTQPYAIYYNDGTYMIYDLTEEDLNRIMDRLVVNPLPASRHKYVKISLGILCLTDIRSVIEQKEKDKEGNSQTRSESALPFLTPEEMEWMATHAASWKEKEEEHE